MKFAKRSKIFLIGCSFYGDPFTGSAGWTEENEIGRLWNRFMNYVQNKDSVKYLLQNKVYGLCLSVRV